MCEDWRDILGYEDCYQVSNLGRIRNKERQVACKGGNTRTVKSKLRKCFCNKKGYLTVVLSKNNVLKTFTVHQLVAQAFIPNFIKGTELNHKDGDKKNNNVTNLEISNPSHNQLHAVRTGLVAKAGKSQYRNVTYISNPRAKSKWAGSIRHNGKSTFGWKTFMTELEAAKYVDELLDSIGDTGRLRNFS